MQRPNAVNDPLWQHAKLIHLLQVARSHLNNPVNSGCGAFAPYLEATYRYLQQHSALVKILAINLTDSGLQHYRQRLNETSLDPIDPPNLNNRIRHQIVQHLQQWLDIVFQHNHLWQDIAAELWTKVLAESVLDIETPIGESVIQSLSENPFRLELWEQLFQLTVAPPSPIITSLDTGLSQALMVQLSQDLQLETQSAQTLANFLGLQPDLSPEQPLPILTLPPAWALFLNPLEINPLDINPLDVQPQTTALDPSPAILNPQLAFTQTQSTQAQSTRFADALIANPLTIPDPPIHLEHYLTRPSDLSLIPWELVAQLKQRCGLAPVQLQFLFAAHSQRQSHGLQAAFTLKASEILEQLDWLNDPQSLISPPNLNHLVQQLAHLSITSVWMTDPKVTEVEAFNMSGHPWEIFSEIRGNLDWTTGQIQQPDEMYFTLRPGLWIHQLIRQGGKTVQRSFEQFGQFALKVLQLDHCRDPFLLSLLIHLILSQPSAEKRDQPSIDTVENLLEAALGQTGNPTNLAEADALWGWWNQVLEALLTLGWSPPAAILSEPEPSVHFYLQPYPKWLVDHNCRKPSDWFDQWLSQPMCFGPPPFVIHASAAPASSLSSRQRFQEADLILRGNSRASQSKRQWQSDPSPRRRLRFDRLTGSEIRSARKAQRLTQSQLAEALHVHQSLIAKIETGDRAITDDLERSLREVLKL